MKYKCTKCKTIHDDKNQAMTCCPNIQVVNEYPKNMLTLLYLFNDFIKSIESEASKQNCVVFEIEGTFYHDNGDLHVSFVADEKICYEHIDYTLDYKLDIGVDYINTFEKVFCLADLAKFCVVEYMIKSKELKKNIL